MTNTKAAKTFKPKRAENGSIHGITSQPSPSGREKKRKEKEKEERKEGKRRKKKEKKEEQKDGEIEKK